ncbi:MAG: phage minor head protein, partial [Pseudomonadota bacterium]
MSKETDAGLRSVVRAAQRAAELAGRPRSGQLKAATRAARRYIQLKDSGGRLADGDGILNFREAIRAARQRGVVLPEVYYGELQDVARQAAFTASGLSRLAQIEELKQEMDRVFDEGGTFRDFKKRVRDGEIAPELSDHRLETILRTNTQGNLARGRCAHHARHKDTRPYLRYSAVNDSRTRASHAAQHGRVEPQDSDFWSQWTPPNGFNCRCTVTSLSERQAKRYQERDEQRQTSDVVKARQEAQPDSGFDYSPCDEPDRGMQESLKRHGVQQPKPIADEIEKLSSRAQTHDKVDPDPDDPREQWGET